MRDKYQILGDYHWREYCGNNLYRKHVDKVVDFFRDKKGRLLDIGCGDGLILSKLSENKNLHCFGIDISPTAIDMARARGVHNCTVLDLFELTKADRYDYIFMGDALEHLPDCEKALTKVKEHLEEEILITIPLQKRKDEFDYHLFIKESAFNLIRKLFKIVSFEENHKKMYFVASNKRGNNVGP